MTTSILTSLFVSALASASIANAAPLKAILADASLLKEAGIPSLRTESLTKVSYAQITAEQEIALSRLAHEHGKCGGFEALPFQGVQAQSPLLTSAFGQLADQELKNRRYIASSKAFETMQPKPEITAAVSEVSEDQLRQTVNLLAAFNDRTYNGSRPNEGVEAMRTRITDVLKGATLPVQVDVIKHQGISQNSLRARIVGSTRPNEIVVLGGHLDSINQEWFGSGQAPGADDNASGSSNILEALRILSHQKQPERTIEFFWYAGEEGGLLGSAEIAQDYKSEKKDVVGVMQLDMTLYAGSGQFVLGSMTDFTSAWLRSYFENINTLYIKAKIVNDKCGYGCSDHASWNRQGYPALMPFEATFNDMNHNLHTSNDVVDSNSNFTHSAMFAKIAVAYAMDL
jgi:leucyl aminopeptidase